MALNRNNYLRWNGTFTKRPYTITPVPKFFDFFANIDSIVIQPMITSSASLGIDYTTYKITSIIDQYTGLPIQLSQDCAYDGAGNLTVYRPIIPTLGFVINGTFEDNSGNLSSILSNLIIVTAIEIAWVVYPVSYVCNIDSFGNQTGFKSWTQLYLINASTLSPIIPLTFKPNIPTDPDYIAPVIDLITCPSDYVGSGGYCPLTISNFSQNVTDPSPLNFINITSLFLFNPTAGIGGTPVSINISGINITPGQSRTYNIPAAIPWTISIGFNVNPGGNMVTTSVQRFWKLNVVGVISDYPTPLTPNNVINTPPESATGTNNPLTLSFPLGATIFVQ